MAANGSVSQVGARKTSLPSAETIARRLLGARPAPRRVLIFGVRRAILSAGEPGVAGKRRGTATVAPPERRGNDDELAYFVGVRAGWSLLLIAPVGVLAVRAVGGPRRTANAVLVGADIALHRPAAPATDAPATDAPHADAADALPTSCRHRAGARARDTVARPAGAPPIPIRHVLILVQENRSYDHYFGHLADAGQPASERIPASFGNPDARGKWVTPFHLPSTCVPRDPPHQWSNMHAHWNHGRMNGFVVEAEHARSEPAKTSAAHDERQTRDDEADADDDDPTSGGRFALGTYNQRDLPFYYYLARTFTIADRYFSAAMAGTWPNRQFLYTGTAQKRQAPTGVLAGARTIFDSLDHAGVSWAVYTDGPARQDCIGWAARAPGVKSTDALFHALRTGTLPAVSFLDPGADDEHPPADVQRGEAGARLLFDALIASPAWRESVLFLTYDEGGGFFDHVPPPAACPPSADRAEYARRGTRVPLLVISPWARRHHVSHVVGDHASLLRFIELLFDLPALTARDANADALLDAFDFDRPPTLDVPPAPAAGRGGCRRVHVVASR
jgi:phospholipase C